jgi:hypothetical protein
VIGFNLFKYNAPATGVYGIRCKTCGCVISENELTEQLSCDCPQNPVYLRRCVDGGIVHSWPMDNLEFICINQRLDTVHEASGLPIRFSSDLPF